MPGAVGRTLGLVCAIVWASVFEAAAGPPLLADDPNTVGPGNFAVILFGATLGTAPQSDVAGPGLDMTLGLYEGIDFLAVVSPNFLIPESASTVSSGLIDVGFKLQPVLGVHWRAAFTPTFTLDTASASEAGVLLPVQVEYNWDRFAIGLDVGYQVKFETGDQWFGAGYGSFTVNDELTWFVEGYGGRTPNINAKVAMFTTGFQLALTDALQLLADGGVGVRTDDGRTVAWYGYLGVQRTFTLWGGG